VDGNSKSQREKTRKDIEAELRRTFRPEFLNRIDDIIVLSPLSHENVMDIVSLQLAELQERLDEYGVKLEVSSEARSWLAEQGYDPLLGARPLKRAMQKYLESPLATQLLASGYQAGDVVFVDKDPEGALSFTKREHANSERDPAAE